MHAILANKTEKRQVDFHVNLLNYTVASTLHKVSMSEASNRLVMKTLRNLMCAIFKAPHCTFDE